MATSLLDWIANLIEDRDARDAFDHDPRGYAEHHGFHNLSGEDVHDVLALLADDGYAHSGHGHHHYPAPDRWDPDHHSAADGGARYLHHYLNSHHDTWEGWDRGDTDNDITTSVHQHIGTGPDHDWDRDWGDWDDHWGGDIHQTVDNDPVVASGRGAVAGGGDLRDSTVTTGDGDVVGYDNRAVAGDHDTTAFGSGDASHAHLAHTSVGDGGAVSIDGDARGADTDNDTTTSVHNSGSGSTSVTAAGDHGDARSYADQSEHDTSTHTHYEDDSRSDSHDDYNSHNSSSYQDSHDYDVHHH